MSFKSQEKKRAEIWSHFTVSKTKEPYTDQLYSDQLTLYFYIHQEL